MPRTVACYAQVGRIWSYVCAWRDNRLVRTALGVLCAGFVLTACGGSSSSSSSSSGWSHLSTVRVTVAQPGLPPPFGRPKTTSFATSARLARVTALLNAHHIAQASATTPSSGCGGGFQIAIVIVPRGSAPVKLNAYRCANRTSGDVSGDLVGFLTSIGVKV
jgi:hypothetical protein